MSRSCEGSGKEEGLVIATLVFLPTRFRYLLHIPCGLRFLLGCFHFSFLSLSVSFFSVFPSAGFGFPSQEGSRFFTLRNMACWAFFRGCNCNWGLGMALWLGRDLTSHNGVGLIGWSSDSFYFYPSSLFFPLLFLGWLSRHHLHEVRRRGKGSMPGAGLGFVLSCVLYVCT